MKQKFIVEVKIPDGASIRDVQVYVMQAVSCWSGGLEPFVDPLFEITSHDVRVTRVQKVKTKGKRSGSR